VELMLTKPGTRLGLNNGKVEVRKDGVVIGKHPAAIIGSLICFPGVHPNESVISQVSRNGGSIVFLSSTGRIKSMLVGAGDIGNVKSRIQQFASFAVDDICLELARLIVKAKIHNMDRFKNEFSAEINDELKKLKNTVLGIDSISNLRGVEGLATRVYFSELRKRIPQNHRSNKRVKRFGGDALNQVQSFAYTLLHHTMIGLIHGAGLDPYLGFYHQPSYNHAALASDLMESYRAQVCDRIILRVFKTSNFLQELAGRSVDGKMLSPGALSILRKAYTKRLQEEVAHNGERKSFLRLMLGDVFSLRRFLNREQPGFVPWMR